MSPPDAVKNSGVAFERSASEHLCTRDGGKAKTSWPTSWFNVVQTVVHKSEGKAEGRTRSREREGTHHDIFCFPTQMAMSSAVRALLSSVQVGRRRDNRGEAGELDWTGCDVRLPEMSYQGPSRRFIMMIVRLGGGACEVLAADLEGGRRPGRRRNRGAVR